MNKVNDGGPAFPVSEIGTHGTYGMSLRDYFAAKAMQAFIAANPEAWRGNIAVDAYAQADALLAALPGKTEVE